MREITLLLIHCSATAEDQDIGVNQIRQWHTSAPNNWEDVGYHYVIRRNGSIERGRDDETVGSHAKGHNFNSLGICLVGGVDANDMAKAECNFTRQQWASLDRLVSELKAKHPRAEIMGHRDLPNVHKACPSFDAKAWWNGKP